jgi:hypothetical protein
MIRTYRRSAEAEDVKALKRGKGSPVRNILTVTFPIGAVVFAALYAVTDSYVLPSIVAGVLVLGSIRSNLEFFKTAGARETARAGRPSVEVIEVEASRVFEIEHLGSNGPAYCFFTGDGNTLLVVGQWLMEFPTFPTLSFRLSRWMDDGKPIRIETTGPEVTPEPSTVALQGHYSNGDIEVFRARPETLQQDLEDAFGKRASP